MVWKPVRVCYTITDDKDSADKSYYYLKGQGRNPTLSLRDELPEADQPRCKGKYVVWFIQQPEGTPNTNSPSPIRSA